MNKKIIGIAGKIATGKSTLLHHFQNFASTQAIDLFTINGDIIRRNILSHSTDHKHITLRKKLINHLHLQHFQKNYALNGREFQKEIFHHPTKYNIYRETIIKEIGREITEQCTKTSKHILLERALLVEDNFLGIPFDHIYYLTCADSKIFSALNGGDLNQSAIVERLKNFYTLQQALSILEGQYPEKYTLIDTTIFPTKNFYKNLFNSMFLCDDS